MAPVSGRVVLIAESDEAWQTRKRNLKKFLRRLKRRIGLHFKDFEGLKGETLHSEDVVILFHCGVCLPESIVLLLTQFITRHRGTLLILPNGDETENDVSRKKLNELAKRFSVTFENTVALSVANSDIVHHPSHLYLTPQTLSTNSPQKEVSQEAKRLLIPSSAILTCQKPAVGFLKTDATCFPQNQTIGAVWQQTGAGKVVIFGSCGLFQDTYIDQEANNDFIEELFTWLLSSSSTIPKTISESPPPSSFPKTSPEISTLAETLKYSLPLGEKEGSLEFDWSLFGFDFRHVSRVEELRKELHVTDSQLSIIAPQLIVPTRVLFPSYFKIEGPRIQVPSLELFDLDEEVKESRSKLDDAFRKTQNLISFVEHAGSICGLDGHSPHDVLHKAMEQIIEYKK